MRFATLGGLVSACLGILVVPAASGAPVAKSPLPLLVPYGERAGLGPLPPHRGWNASVTAGGCTSDAGYYFVGLPNLLGNFAGNLSGVLAGDSNEACSKADAIAGGNVNIIGGAGDGGAASNSFIGSGAANAITAAYAFVGAGESNKLSGFASFIGSGVINSGTGGDSFIGGGKANTESANFSAIAAGYYNTVSGLASYIGAGFDNTASGADSSAGAGEYNNAQGNGSFIGAGDYLLGTSCTKDCSRLGNTVTGVDSFIGAGDQNSISESQAFVGGGSHNAIAGSGDWGTIGGGHGNIVTGTYATIPGGANNTAAGVLSLAAGYHADATRTGSFVWSDYVAGSPVVKDSAPDQFVVRASGGAYVYSSENLKAGVKLAAGSGTWASLSDRDAKADITPVDDAAILEKVATLPVNAWRYKTEAGVRHVGPMAQDFYAAFRVGEDDRHITTIDEDGVALAAIKALRANVVSLQAHNATLRAGNVRLRADIANLHTENANLTDRLTALEKKVETLATR